MVNKDYQFASWQRRPGFKKWAGQEIAIFRLIAANFPHRRLWVLRVLMLRLNFPKMWEGVSLHFWTKNIGQKKKIFRQPKI